MSGQRRRLRCRDDVRRGGCGRCDGVRATLLSFPRISSPQLIQTSVSAICCLHFLLCQLFKFAISLTSAICWYIPSFAHLSSSLLSQHHLGCWMCARLLYCTCVLVRAVLHSDSDSESDHEILLLLFSGSSTHRVPSRPSLLFVSLVQGALLEIR